MSNRRHLMKPLRPGPVPVLREVRMHPAVSRPVRRRGGVAEPMSYGDRVSNYERQNGALRLAGPQRRRLFKKANQTLKREQVKRGIR